MNTNLHIENYIKDGEYVRGNSSHPELIKAWLESKGAKVNKQITCSNLYCFYYVDAIYLLK